MREGQTEVLIVGAGPVGLLTALFLGEAGIGVRIIDREARTTSRSYACALHPRVLALLDRFGVTPALQRRGRQVPTMAFYDGAERRAEVELAQSSAAFPFLLILPQEALEKTLEDRLREQTGVAVEWNHRFDGYQAEGDSVVVRVEKLGGTALGYIVPHWETVVEKQFPVQARFLVGADGHHSLVRQRLGVELAGPAVPEYFAAYEFETEGLAAAEARVVLDEGTTNVLWPLPGNRSRWTFQLTKSEVAAEFPEKERRAVQFEHVAADPRVRQFVEKLCRERAPWFDGGIRAVTWCTSVAFTPQLAGSYGRERCWLAGDAAHQTGPVGAQSMNVGMCEAAALAGRLRAILRGGASLGSLGQYESQWRGLWQQLLGTEGGLRPRPQTSDWVRRRAGRLLPCLPGCGDELAGLANQLALDFQRGS